MPSVSIIIVSWNVREVLRQCLDSIYATAASLSPEIVVVDSASADGTAEMLRLNYPGVRLLAQSQNVGFSRGNNIGLRAATGELLFLLNPDTIMWPGCLQSLVAYMLEAPDIAAVGPQTRSPDGSVQSTRRRFPSLLLAAFESTWLEPYAPPGLIDRYRIRDQSDDGGFDVDWVQGSAILIRRAAYDQIGGLDDGYFMYSEELDWCWRARLQGWRVRYAGDAVLTHLGGASSSQVAAQTHVAFQTSKLRFLRKAYGELAAQMIRLIILGNYAVQTGLEAAKLMLGSQPDVRAGRLRAYARVLVSGLRVR